MKIRTLFHTEWFPPKTKENFVFELSEIGQAPTLSIFEK